MLIWNKYFPAFEVPGEPSGGGVSTPPVEPPSNPTDANPEAISQSDEWVLGHFDGLQADDAQEDITSVEPATQVPEVQPSALAEQVSAQAGRPEGASPSVPTGQAPPASAAIATPAPVTAAPSAQVPPVGAAATQPAALVPQTPNPQAPDPTQIMSQIARGIEQQKAEFIKELANTRYALSEKDADELGLTPEQAKLWAQRQATQHVDIVASITQMQAQNLPVFLNGMLEAKTVNQRREDEFFTQWPQLKAQPKDKLVEIFKAVNTLNPDLKGEAWSKRAGEMACLQLGVPMQQVNGGVQVSQQQVRTPGPIVRSVPGMSHQPVGTSTAPAPTAQLSEAENFFRLLQATDAGVFDNE